MADEENQTFDTLGALYEALSKAQGEIKPPKKNAEAHFGKYANLSSILEAIKGPFSKHGLCVSQQITDQGLRTVLAHKDGGRLVSLMPLPSPVQVKIQEYGKQLTYSRRYSITAIVGIEGDEENDPDNPQAHKGASSAKPAQRKAPAMKAAPKTPGGLTEAQLKRLFTLAGKANVAKDQVQDYMKGEFKIESSRDLNKKQYDEICGWIQSLIDGPPPQAEEKPKNYAPGAH